MPEAEKKHECHVCHKDPGGGWYIYDDKIWCEKCWCSGPGASWRARKTIVRAQDLGTEVAVYWQLPAKAPRG